MTNRKVEEPMEYLEGLEDEESDGEPTSPLSPLVERRVTERSIDSDGAPLM